MSPRAPRLLLRAAMLFVVLGGFSTTAIPSATAAPATVLSQEDSDAWLEDLVPERLEKEEIAGASVAIVHEGEVIAARGFGLADTGQVTGEQIPADDSTLFRIGSIAKLMTANAVMVLVERGELDLDAPVSGYLDFELETQFAEPVTLRHLLSHTAGFEDRISGVVVVGGDKAPPLREVVAHPPAQIFAPGTTPSYSNYGNSLAGYVVEHISGMPFEEFMRGAVFDPAGMATASGEQPLPPMLAPLLSRGYTTSSSPEVPFEVVGTAPAGSVSASANDMAGFMLSQLHAPSTVASPVLSPVSLTQLQQPALTTKYLGNLANGNQMTLGYFEGQRNGHRTVGHGGDLFAFHSQLELYPESRTGIYVAVNSLGVQPDSTVRFREELMQAFADRYFPAMGTTQEPIRMETSADHANIAAGEYWSTRRVESSFLKLYFGLLPVKVKVTNNGTLTIADPVLGSTDPVEFQEVEPWIWQEVGGERRVAMAADAHHVTMIGTMPAMTLQPLPISFQALPTVLVVTGVALLGALLTWTAAAIMRMRRSAPVTRSMRWLRRASQLCAVGLVVALGVWVFVGLSFLNGSSAPEWQVRTAQALLVLGIAGIIPAVLTIVTAIRSRTERTRATSAALALVGYCGVFAIAVAGGLLSANAVS